MPQYRKVKIVPLTELDKLNIQKASEKHYDVSELPQETQKELSQKLMHIVRKSEGAIISKPIKGKQYVSALARTTKQKGKIFAFPEPNPIHAYYKMAIEHLEKADLASQHFRQTHNNPESEYQNFCNFFEEITRGIIFLLMTIEGFINQLPQEGVIYRIEGVNKVKNDIEWMNVTDKLRLAVPALTGNDIFTTNRPVYDRLHLLNGLRNDLIHLKKLELANFTYYQELYKRLLDFPCHDVANAVFDLVNIISPGFFSEEN